MGAVKGQDMTRGPHEIESAIESVRAVLDALPRDFSSSDLCPTDHLRHVLDVLQTIAAERQPLDSSPGSPSRHWLPGLPDKRFEDPKELAHKDLKAHAMGIREAVRIISDVHTSDEPGSPQGFGIEGVLPNFEKGDGELYWEAWHVLRQYAARDEEQPAPIHPSPTAVKLFQRALAIQAAGTAAQKWEPEGKRIEYIGIDIALMRELRGNVWGVSVLDVDENEEGPPAWLRDSWTIASWREALSLRRALLDAMREKRVGECTRSL
jgi:hypothetical protein